MKKKILTVLVTAALAAATLASCGKQNDTITVVSREDGSGTRGAFTELMGIDKDGTDMAYAKAERHRLHIARFARRFGQGR